MSSLAFPVGKYRMLISAVPDEATSVLRGKELNGSIMLEYLDGRPAITMRSGETGMLETVAVPYGSVRADQGSIGPFSIVLNSTRWNFASMSIFEFSPGTVHLLSFQLAVGNIPYNLFAIPEAMKIPRRKFVVKNNDEDEIGELKITSDTLGKFTPIGETPIKVTVSGDSVSWKVGLKEYHGFLFGLGLHAKHKKAEGNIGLVGATLLTVGAGDGDDWEATAVGP